MLESVAMGEKSWRATYQALLKGGMRRDNAEFQAGAVSREYTQKTTGYRLAQLPAQTATARWRTGSSHHQQAAGNLTLVQVWVR